MITDLDLSLRLADAADAISLSRFRSYDLFVATKADQSPVTDADQKVESALRELIAQERPEDSFIGEEFENGVAGERTWIIDPIDGTANFMRGLPIWATLIALRVNGEIVTSVVSAPALGRRWWATTGNGAFTMDIDGSVRSIQVSEISELAKASISYNSLQLWDQSGKLPELLELSRSVWRTRAHGDFLSYMFLAEGSLEMVAEHDLKVYDIAALVPIIKEAGGQITALSGPLTEETSSTLATNRVMHDKFQALLG